MTASGGDNVLSQSKVDDLESEVIQLREQLAKAKSINDAMWDTVVQRAISQSRDKGEEEDPEPRRKRGRV